MPNNKRLATIIIVTASVLALGSCSLFKNSQAPDDNGITSAIEAKLFQDPMLKSRDVRVVSQKGVVVLSGMVASDNEKASVEQIANGVGGVKQVIDELTVSPGAGASEAEAAPAAAPQPATEVAPTRRETPRRRERRRAHAEEMASSGQPAEDASASAQPPAQPAVAAAPPAPQPVQYTIPAGTVVTVQMIDSIDSSRVHAGDELAATIASPIVAGDKVVVPHNSDARVRVVEVDTSGHFRGQSALQVELVSFSAGGNSYEVQSGVYQKLGQARGKRSAETIGGGAGLGALIGAIVGHGKGAAIGGAIGAGAGTAAQAATKAPPVVIPSEAKIDFTLKSPVTVTLNP